MSVVELDIYAGTDPNGTLLVTLTDDDVSDWEMRDGENSLGSGWFTIRRDHASATEANLATGNYVKVRIPIIDTDPVFGFWIDEHDDTILAYDEEGAEVLTRQGPGTLAILARAKFLEDNWATVPPATATRGTNAEVPGFWRWTHQPYGAIFKRFIEEGQNEPGEPLGDVTTDFDRDDDSDATPWPEIVRDVRFPIGTDGLELLQAFAQTGELYVRSTPDLLISGHQARGTDRTSATFASGKVRFAKGVNINTDLSRSGQGILKATHALVVGSDFKYRRVVSPDYTTGTGRWITVDYPESNDDDVLDKVGLEELARGEAQQQSLTLEIKAGDDEGLGLYLPYLHFKTGDLVTLDTGPAAWDYDETSQRVAGFTIGIRDASDDVTDEMAARSLVINVELGGSPSNGGFGDLGATRSTSDDPFWVDGGISGASRTMRMRDYGSEYYYLAAAARGVFGENDAYISLTADQGDETAAIDIFAYNQTASSYAELILENGEWVAIASKLWQASVDGTDPATSKHYFVGGFGLVLDTTLTDTDPDPGDSQAGQIIFNGTEMVHKGYDGAAWYAFGSGGGGSGDVATDTIWDAVGDLAVGSGVDTADNLTVGADGDYLVADSGEALGVKWAAAPTGGLDADADSIGPFAAINGYRLPTGRNYIRQDDLGNTGEDAFITLSQGQVSIVGRIEDGGSNPDNAAAEIWINNDSPASFNFFIYDDNTYVEIRQNLIDGIVLDSNALSVVCQGRSFMLPQAASAPSSPVEGESYYDTSLNKSRTYDGTTWQDHW